MKYKVCELEGVLLDAAVAELGDKAWRFSKDGTQVVDPARCLATSPSTRWIEAGPIIEREQIGLTYIPTNDRGDEAFWCASILRDPASEHTKLFEGFHASPLVAAMRAFVASRLGEEIDLEAPE